MPLPSLEQVRTLPAYSETAVPDDYVDENGHMNITDYFRLGARAPWLRLGELGLGTHYLERGHSFFVVQHHIAYLGELRQGDRFSVRPGFAGQSAKALHGIAYVVDEDRGRIACSLEVMYVHVSLDSRRAVAVPDDVAAVLAAEIGAHPWVTGCADGLALR